MILPTLLELGVGFVAYSPLGRGVLTGRLDRNAISSEGDFRQFLPRFSETNFEANMQQTEKLIALANKKGITPAQTALAWLLSKGDDIVPIPGTRREKYLMENIQAAEAVLTADDIVFLEAAFSPGSIQGERYTPEGMAGVNK